jgi:hypothetical protein
MSATVESLGALRLPVSSAAIVAGLSRHRSASPSWVRLAAIGNRLSSSANDADIVRILP